MMYYLTVREICGFYRLCYWQILLEICSWNAETKMHVSPAVSDHLAKLDRLFSKHFLTWRFVSVTGFLDGRHMDVSHSEKAEVEMIKSIMAEFHVATSVAGSWCRTCWLTVTLTVTSALFLLWQVKPPVQTWHQLIQSHEDSFMERCERTRDGLENMCGVGLGHIWAQSFSCENANASWAEHRRTLSSCPLPQSN